MSKNDREFKPVVIRCVNDIKKAIIPFTKEVNDGKVELVQTVEWKDEGKKSSAQVSAYSSDVSMRKMLLDGFEQVKQQEQMLSNLHDVLDDDEYAPTLPKANINDVPMKVDQIIKHRLGGKRDGLTVIWEVNNKKVVFDPYTKELHEYDD